MWTVEALVLNLTQGEVKSLVKLLTRLNVQMNRQILHEQKNIMKYYDNAANSAN